MTVIRRGQTEAQSEFKIIFLIKSVLTLCMTYLGIFFPHYSLNLGFFFDQTGISFLSINII